MFRSSNHKYAFFALNSPYSESIIVFLSSTYKRDHTEELSMAKPTRIRLGNMMAPSLPWHCFQLPLLTDVARAGPHNQSFVLTVFFW